MLKPPLENSSTSNFWIAEAVRSEFAKRPRSAVEGLKKELSSVPSCEGALISTRLDACRNDAVNGTHLAAPWSYDCCCFACHWLINNCYCFLVCVVFK